MVHIKTSYVHSKIQVFILMFPELVGHSKKEERASEGKKSLRKKERELRCTFGSRPVVPDAREDKTYLQSSSIPGSMALSLSPKAKDLQVMSK